MRIIVALASILAAGCATQKPLYLPDGRQGYAIECSGTAMTWNECYEKAGEICKSNGYEVVNKNTDASQVISGSSYGVAGATVQKRGILIACK